MQYPRPAEAPTKLAVSWQFASIFDGGQTEVHVPTLCAGTSSLFRRPLSVVRADRNAGSRREAEDHPMRCELAQGGGRLLRYAAAVFHDWRHRKALQREFQALGDIEGDRILHDCGMSRSEFLSSLDNNLL